MWAVSARGVTRAPDSFYDSPCHTSPLPFLSYNGLSGGSTPELLSQCLKSLTGLQSIRMGHNGLGTSSLLAEALSASTGLTRLSIASIGLDAQLKGAAACSWAQAIGKLTALQGLDLSGNRLGTPFSSGSQSRGRQLNDLRPGYDGGDNEGDQEEGEGEGCARDESMPSSTIVISLAALSRLRCLDLTRSGLRGQEVDLAGSLRNLAALERLGLNGNDLGPEGVTDLAAALGSLSCLQRLGLGNNLLGDDGVEVLADALLGQNGMAHSLERLDLRKNGITVRGAVALVPALMAPMRLHLDIDENEGPAGPFLKSVLRAQKHRMAANT